MDWLDSCKTLGDAGLTALGHRVVHDGDLFVDSIIINDHVIKGIEAISHLAPLHDEPALSAILATVAILESDISQAAVFDTVFHRTLPERTARHAIPLALAEKHNIRRYGFFHGLVHSYMAERYAAIITTPVEQAKLIMLQLGNDCSATAIENGLSVDTSMGFTPLKVS